MKKWTSKSIKELRKSYDLSQTEFSILIGSDRQQTVSSWERRNRALKGMQAILMSLVADKFKLLGATDLKRMAKRGENVLS